MKKIFEKLVEYLFPSRCNLCGVILECDSYFGLCTSCCQNLEFVKENCCQKCGKEMKNYFNENCSDCTEHIRYFDNAYSIVRYTGIIRKLLIDYKFYRKKEIRNTFSKLLLCKYDYLDNVDIVLGVPSHKIKKKKRGFNQAQEIAKEFAREIDVEFNDELITKIINTKSQSSLSKNKRITNLEGAFKVINREKIQGKNILLIDDIYTTGSTVSECSKELKSKGANKVYVFTVASGKGY